MTLPLIALLAAMLALVVFPPRAQMPMRAALVARRRRRG